MSELHIFDMAHVWYWIAFFAGANVGLLISSLIKEAAR
jgi:hypothetical protein